MKRIKILSLGGTISASITNETDYINYKTGAYETTYWKQQFPELFELAEIDWVDLATISSSDITSELLLKLRELVQKTLLEEDFDAVIISQGTSTLEETAYFLHLSIATEKPIILTGAQRPHGTYGSDALSNLYQSVQVACSEKAIGKGALVVFNASIHSAREVNKTDTYSLESFQSPTTGAMGEILASGEVAFYNKPNYKHTLHSEFSKTEITQLPNIEMLLSYPDIHPKFLQLIATEDNIQGSILIGTGAGLITSSQEEALWQAVEAGKILVRASRCATGAVLPTTAYPSDKILAAGSLSPQKARIFLQLALCKSKDLETLQEWIETH